MTLQELKNEIQKYQYFEDTGFIDVALASVIATRLKLGNPIWMVFIGASSSGKSQLLRPLALTDEKFMHRIDDLTENTFLSGMTGKDKNMSLLHRIGSMGMLVMSDLTVLFSKNAEAKGAILSQFRMIYDGEMTKFSGSKDKPITWKGSLGVISGSTPSIYRHFEENADMGERFIYYRMREYDRRKTMVLANSRGIQGHELDTIMSGLFREYLKGVNDKMADGKAVSVPSLVNDRLLEIALFSEKIRTSVPMDWNGTNIDDIPVVAFPTRLYLQLLTLAKGMVAMKDDLIESDVRTLEWCGYSLANEKKRACLRVLCRNPYGSGMKTSSIADKIGLPTPAVSRALQCLAAVGVVKRTGDSENLYWEIIEKADWDTVRRLEGIFETMLDDAKRVTSAEETEEMEAVMDNALDMFVKQE